MSCPADWVFSQVYEHYLELAMYQAMLADLQPEEAVARHWLVGKCLDLKHQIRAIMGQWLPGTQDEWCRRLVALGVRATY